MRGDGTISSARTAARQVVTAAALAAGICAIAGSALAVMPPRPLHRPADIGLLSVEQRDSYRDAVRAVDRGRWAEAQELADKSGDALLQTYVEWAYCGARGSGADLRRIDSFLSNNREWPYRSRLLRRAEEAIDAVTETGTVIDWFTRHEPVTGEGMVRFGEALIEGGRTEAGTEWIRRAWREHAFSRAEAQALYRKHSSRLTEADHAARLDQLLWYGHRGSVLRMYSVVPDGLRRLAEARLGLATSAPNVDQLVARVPATLESDPGLLYERIRWRRHHGKHEGARELLALATEDAGPRPDRWWFERQVQVRLLMDERDWQGAYDMLAAHRQEPGGLPYAEAEFLAGWLALRKLDDPNRAYPHFARLYHAVTMPISLSRGAYWAYRAAAAAGQADLAENWRQTAAAHGTTYYGQLAWAARSKRGSMPQPAEPVPSPEAREAFDQEPLVRLVRRFAAAGLSEEIRPFLLYLAEETTSPMRHVLVARLAGEVARPELAVRTAKIATRDGVVLPRLGYPIVALEQGEPEPALVLAVARQESEFNAEAVSPAGARGLMQLMPATAKEVSRALRLGYDPGRLLSDRRYNMSLGGAYLGGLIERFQGSYILALAAYNAGPSRAWRWIKDYGDPRDAGIDAIDWVEMIPFSETRNYVQRVMENLQVYRVRLSDRDGHPTLLADLNRAAGGS